MYPFGRDLERPVGLLLVAMLHFLTDAQPPTTSYAATGTAPDRAALLERFYAATSSPGQARSRIGIARFFDDLDLIAPPGLVHVADWPTRPTAVEDTDIPPEQAWVLGGVGRLPHSSRTDTAR